MSIFVLQGLLWLHVIMFPGHSFMSLCLSVVCWVYRGVFVFFSLLKWKVTRARAHTHTDILFGKLLNSPLKHRKVVAEKGRGSFKKLNMAQRLTVRASRLFTSLLFLLDDRSVRNTLPWLWKRPFRKCYHSHVHKSNRRAEMTPSLTEPGTDFFSFIDRRGVVRAPCKPGANPQTANNPSLSRGPREAEPQSLTYYKQMLAAFASQLVILSRNACLLITFTSFNYPHIKTQNWIF